MKIIFNKSYVMFISYYPFYDLNLSVLDLN